MMRVVLTLVCLLWCYSVMRAQKDTADLPLYSIKFYQTQYNFGTVKANVQVEYVFTFTNISKKPIIVTRPQGSGGCAIIAEYTKESVLPGKEGVVKVIMKCNAGVVHKQFTIITNGSNTPIVLIIKANVVNEVSEPVESPSQK